jgi:hypothetical protein
MLGAGVMAAGDVKIEGLIEDQESLIDKIREHDGVSFGIGCGETAALVTGTGDRATKHCACFVVEAGGSEYLLSGREIMSGDVRDEEVLPDGEANLARAEAV